MNPLRAMVVLLVIAGGALTGYAEPVTYRTYDGVTLFVDTSSHALRRVVWRSTFPLRSVENEDTLEIEPTFDGPMEPTAFDHNVASTGRSER